MKNNDELIDYLVRIGSIKSKKVENAFRHVDRKNFVSSEYAYEDTPLEIGYEQTISQPTTVAIMTELLNVNKKHKILEIGTGSGYQAAILSFLAKEVYTVERINELYESAKNRLSIYKNIHPSLAGKKLGLEEYSPYDRIIVTAGAEKLPPIVEQLKSSGVMVAPVGERMLVVKKSGKDIFIEEHGEYRFVPLVYKSDLKSETL